MSAASSLIFYGIRFDVAQSDIEALEQRIHPWIVKARSVGLNFYWENVGGLSPRYLFFIGRKIGIIGVENETEMIISESELVLKMAEVNAKLKAVGYSEDPKLYFQLIPD